MTEMSKKLEEAAQSPEYAEVFDNANDSPYGKPKRSNIRSSDILIIPNSKKEDKGLPTEAGSPNFDPEFTSSLATNMPDSVREEIKKKLS